MRAALIFALLLPGLAAQKCASPGKKICMEACYPDHRHDNVDADRDDNEGCCTIREWAWCAEGYRLVKSGKSSPAPSPALWSAKSPSDLSCTKRGRGEGGGRGSSLRSMARSASACIQRARRARTAVFL